MLTEAYQRITDSFASADGVNLLEAWHFIPLETQVKDTVVILGHGLGGSKDMGLERYAAQYALAGSSLPASQPPEYPPAAVYGPPFSQYLFGFGGEGKLRPP